MTSIRRYIQIIESATSGFRQVSFDDLPRAVQDDICANLAEHHPFFLEMRYDAEDARANLVGLVDPPVVLIGHMPVSDLLKTQQRQNSPAAVEKYAAMLRANPRFEFDPILIAGGRFYDGGHRLAAYAAAGRPTIPCVECGNIVLASSDRWQKWVDGDVATRFAIDEEEEVLTEAMKGIDGLALNISTFHNGFGLVLYDPSDMTTALATATVLPLEMNDFWIVHNVVATHGYGPPIYAIAADLVAPKSGIIVPSNDVSVYAQRMWKRFSENPFVDVVSIKQHGRPGYLDPSFGLKAKGNLDVAHVVKADKEIAEVDSERHTRFIRTAFNTMRNYLLDD